ncbi:hypothetical protein JHL21_02695 [Devosia sp. WQ 349]|uniref:hypothetical protein n=1 Tax=Devosia sp. WQ 349K1 TaxID=2800329 RepID=UPI0019033F53|nr:hypothetical protein [Devosia sp. WQ 349K1]MBK1793405.1 hypothetical protein [Devosia sp. WQ 349K1]
MTDKANALSQLADKLSYRVENPSAWPEGFDQAGSDLFREAATTIRAFATASNPLQSVLDRFPGGEAAFNAVLQCPHEVDAEKVILKAGHSKPGNALAQLHARLSALETTPAPVSEITEEMVERLCFAAAKYAPACGGNYSRALFHTPEAAALRRVLTAAMGGGPARQASQAARDVLSERQRQMSAEGWATEHDDAHTNGELATAAGCYALGDKLTMREVDGPGTIVAPVQWPWFGCWWKPKTRRQDLVRAGALIIAEIERLDRSAAIRGE